MFVVLFACSPERVRSVYGVEAARPLPSPTIHGGPRVAARGALVAAPRVLWTPDPDDVCAPRCDVDLAELRPPLWAATAIPEVRAMQRRDPSTGDIVTTHGRDWTPESLVAAAPAYAPVELVARSARLNAVLEDAVRACPYTIFACPAALETSVVELLGLSEERPPLLVEEHAHSHFGDRLDLVDAEVARELCELTRDVAEVRARWVALPYQTAARWIFETVGDAARAVRAGERLYAEWSRWDEQHDPE